MGEAAKIMAYILIKGEIRLVTFIVVIMGVSNLALRLIP